MSSSLSWNTILTYLLCSVWNTWRSSLKTVTTVINPPENPDFTLRFLKKVHTGAVGFDLSQGYTRKTHSDICPFCQADILLRLQNSNDNLCFGDWSVSNWLMRMDLQKHRHSSCLRKDGLFIYALCVWGVVKASAGYSIMLCMAHMSGTSSSALSPWGYHISCMHGSKADLWSLHLQFTRTFWGVCL